MPRSRAYCFTLNNYTDDQLAAVRSLDCQYMVFGYEECPTTGTPHLQGYVYFKNARNLSALVKVLPGHLTPADGSATDNFNYCTKGGEFEERGNRPADQESKGVSEKRRWDDAFNSALAGDFRAIPTDMLVRHYSSFKKISVDLRAPAVVPTISVLRDWQNDLLAELLQPPDDRSVVWLCDYDGGSGKSAFAKYMRVHHGATILKNGPTRDIGFVMPDAPTIVIFDYARSAEAAVNYEVFEDIKDGQILSSKYESRMKVFNTPHLVVLANFLPDKHKLSADRWSIRVYNAEDGAFYKEEV